MLKMKFTTKRCLLCNGLRKRKSPKRSSRVFWNFFRKQVLKISSISNTVPTGSVRETFLLIGSVLKAQLVHDILKAKCFGLLADEFFDVSNKEQLVTFVKFVHPETGKANTALPAASNLLGNSSSADAEAITNAIVAQLEDAGIDKKKLSSFPQMELQL